MFSALKKLVALVRPTAPSSQGPGGDDTEPEAISSSPPQDAESERLARISEAIEKRLVEAPHPEFRGNEEEVSRWAEEDRRIQAIAQVSAAAGPHVNSLGLRLLSALSRKISGNIFFSPVSLAMALAVLRAGAEGQTASEIDRALDIDADDDLSRAFGGLAEFLSQSQVGCELKLASCVWRDRSIPIKKDFLARVRQELRSEVRPLDFAGKPDRCVSVINAWVRRQTNGLIPAVISDIDPEALFVLTNAIYFRARWTSPFKQTVPGDFHLDGRLGGTKGTVSVPMMHDIARLGYGEDASAQFVELPYRAPGLSMIVVLPKEKTSVQDLESSLADCPALRSDQFSERLVHLTLPSFEFEEDCRLEGLLSKAGLASLFSAELADFGAMSDLRPNFVSQFAHRARIRVDEKGSEAAAATTVAVSLGSSISMPERPVVFRADRPFLFLIYHRYMEMVLFLGRVANPSRTVR